VVRVRGGVPVRRGTYCPPSPESMGPVAPSIPPSIATVSRTGWPSQAVPWLSWAEVGQEDFARPGLRVWMASRLVLQD